MLLSRRSLLLGAERIGIASHRLIHPHFRLSVLWRRGVIVEDSILTGAYPFCDPTGWPVLTLCLQGRARVRHRSREEWLDRGDLALTPDLRSFAGRDEGIDETCRLICFQWDPKALGAPGADEIVRRRIPERTLAALETQAERWCPAPHDLAVGAPGIEFLATVRELARAQGLLVDPRSSLPRLRFDSSSSLSALRLAFDSALSMSGEMPAVVDLERELARPASTLRRLVRRHASLLVEHGSWREARNRWRLAGATALMTHPGATTAGVARALGYGSASSMCRGFARSRLPSPGRIRELVRREA